MAVFTHVIPIGGYRKSFQYPFNVGFRGGGPLSFSETKIEESLGGNATQLLSVYISPFPTRARRVSGSENTMTTHNTAPEMARQFVSCQKIL